jgi:spermidine synthase
MIPWELLGRARVPGSKSELSLHRHGADFSLRCDGLELMNSRTHGSEDALADLACMRIADRKSARVLVGGLGMGFTLAAALRGLPADAEVVLSELVPEVVQWNRTCLADLAGRPLDDARVAVRELDVARVLREQKAAFDAILLDVDNGPEGFTRVSNDGLYGEKGLAAARAALRPAGVLAVWSAGPDRAFAQRLARAGFGVEQLGARGHQPGRGKAGGARNTIWLATCATDASSTRSK